MIGGRIGITLVALATLACSDESPEGESREEGTNSSNSPGSSSGASSTAACPIPPRPGKKISDSADGDMFCGEARWDNGLFVAGQPWYKSASDCFRVAMTMNSDGSPVPEEGTSEAIRVAFYAPYEEGGHCYIEGVDEDGTEGGIQANVDVEGDCTLQRQVPQGDEEAVAIQWFARDGSISRSDDGQFWTLSANARMVRYPFSPSDPSDGVAFNITGKIDYVGEKQDANFGFSSNPTDTGCAAATGCYAATDWTVENENEGDPNCDRFVEETALTAQPYRPKRNGTLVEWGDIDRFFLQACECGFVARYEQVWQTFLDYEAKTVRVTYDGVPVFQGIPPTACKIHFSAPLVEEACE